MTPASRSVSSHPYSPGFPPPVPLHLSLERKKSSKWFGVALALLNAVELAIPDCQVAVNSFVKLIQVKRCFCVKLNETIRFSILKNERHATQALTAISP